MSDLQSKLGNG
ncbi:Protein of unknown function [Bacillus mobilis]|nr:Protein of unknown function [Bacillus mobilis]